MRSSYIIDLERAWQIIAPPTVHYSDHFLYASIILRASPRVLYPEFGGCPVFGCCNYIIIYADISWYIEQRLLFDRRLLLGVSVNRESTVLLTLNKIVAWVYNMVAMNTDGSTFFLTSPVTEIYHASNHLSLPAESRPVS